jgi:hypothetical protein
MILTFKLWFGGSFDEKCACQNSAFKNFLDVKSIKNIFIEGKQITLFIFVLKV